MGFINDFEKIASVDSEILREKLANISVETIVKASIGTAPSNADYLATVFDSIDFTKERDIIGPVRIEEVEAAQQEVIKALN